MCRLTTELEIAGWVEIEACSRRLKLAHSGWAFFDKHLDRSRIAKGGARSQRIASVQFRGVARSQRSGNSTLRVCSSAVE
jgi:hypothetical protein